MNCTASLDTCEPLGCDSGFYDAAKNACTPVRQGVRLLACRPCDRQLCIGC